MNKILFITDTHIGARNGSKIFRELFRQYYKDILFPYIKDNGIEIVIHLGDMFDNRNHLSAQDIDYVMNEFIPGFEDTGAVMYVVTGNHDVAYKNTNSISSLSILHSDSFHIIDDELSVVNTNGDTSFYLCPWLNSENTEKLLEDIETCAGENKILCGHFEFQNAKMYKSSKTCDHGLDHKKFKNYKKILSGHFHHSSTLGNIEYIGALFHYNWMDHNDWRGFTVYDSKTDTFEKVENEYCLFTELDYHEDDIINMSNEDLTNVCTNQFVRIIINDEYKRIELKDILHKIESMSPLAVDVIDNTIVINEKDDDKNIQSTETKGVLEYAEEYIDNSELLELFKNVYSEAQENIKDIE